VYPQICEILKRVSTAAAIVCVFLTVKYNPSDIFAAKKYFIYRIDDIAVAEYHTGVFFSMEFVV